MPELLISDEVSSLLGVAVVDSVRRSAGEYRCVACDVDGDARREDSAVIVLRAEEMPSAIRMAHARCAESAVLEVEFDVDASMAQGVTVGSVAALRAVKGKPQAWLLMEMPSSMELVTKSGEMVSPSVTQLLEGGLHLFGSMEQALPQLKGWCVEVDDRGVGQVLAPGVDGAFLDSLPELPAGWRQLAWRSGWVNLVVGIDIDAVCSSSDPVAEIDRQALGGSTVGARVKVRKAVTRPSERGVTPQERKERAEEAAARQMMATELGKIIRMRAGADNNFTNAPRAVEFPASARVWPTMIPQQEGMKPFPSVVIDLDCTDEGTVAAVLRGCEEVAGFRPWAPGEGTLSFLTQWQYAAWASQILIMRTAGDVRDVLVFEPFVQASLSWYDAVVSPPPGMGVFIGNLHGEQPPGAALFEGRSFLAGCIDGMGAGRRPE